MRRSHLCTGCGFDLARVRSAWTPAVGGHVVRCPRCGTAAIRHAPPAAVRRRRRDHRRLAAALARLVVQLVLGLSLTLGTIAGIEFILRDGFNSILIADIGVPLSAVLAGVPLLAGAWLAAGLRHWPRWTAWSAWSAVVVLAPALLPLLDDSTGHVDRLGSVLREARRSLPWSGLAACLALAGLPIGRQLAAWDDRRHRSAAARRFGAARRRRRTRHRTALTS